MPWIYLFIAGLCEIGWAIGLKYTDGFSRPWPTALTLGAMALSMGFLGLAVKHLPIGNAYAIWTGIGTVGTAILGAVLFGESLSVARIACVGMIAAGIVGLKVAD
jgi:quaternary ammonium compound-resistance protein SugE